MWILFWEVCFVLTSTGVRTCEASATYWPTRLACLQEQKRKVDALEYKAVGITGRMVCMPD